MTDTHRILGTLHTADGRGAIRLADRFDTDVDDLWSAITEPDRLARWIGEVKGDLRVGGEYRARYHPSGWEGTGRIEQCEPPRRLRLTGAEPDDPHGVVTEITLTPDGDQTILVVEKRGMPLDQVAGFGAGNQIQLEDLAAYLAGGDRCDSDARIAVLYPLYAQLPVGNG
ncbi:MAG TPA: SRPBCC family protein [Actinocatenispora sp.]